MKLSTINRIRLAKQLLKFVDITTDEGVALTIDGEYIEVGKEVFTMDENGEMVPAEGTYHYDQKTIVIEGGIVKSVTEDEPETTEVVEETVEETETTEEETMENETEETVEETTETTEEETENGDAERIAELEAALEAANARIAELEAELAKAKEPEAKPAEEEFKQQEEMTQVERVLAFRNKVK